MPIRRLGPSDVDAVIAAAPLFDAAPTVEWAERFLTRDGHHMVLAIEAGAAVGFISGVETIHPDKGTEMMLYELAVDESHRRRGHARALIDALASIAVERGCYGMWVPIEADNDIAVATYRACGGAPAEAALTIGWDLPTA